MEGIVFISPVDEAKRTFALTAFVSGIGPFLQLIGTANRDWRVTCEGEYSGYRKCASAWGTRTAVK